MSAHSLSGNPVTFSIASSSTDSCTVGTTDDDQATVTFGATAGTCVIDAATASQDDWLGGSASQTVHVVLADVITLSQAPEPQDANGSYTIAASDLSDNPVSFSVASSSTNDCTVATSGSNQALVSFGASPGSCTVDASTTAGNGYAAATASETITVAGQPAIGIVKSADISSFSAPGTLVSYSYLVTNTGNVDLGSVTVSDPMANLSPVSCPATTLAPAAFETCTASYTTTQADVDAGGITNTGTAFGTPVNVGSQGSGAGAGKPVAAQSTLTIPAVQTPAIGIVKSADISSFSAPGTLVSYSYLVTNTGNVDLGSVTVSDPMANLSPVSCPATTLAPAAFETCTASYTTTQADVDAGGITNTGTAFGTPVNAGSQGSGAGAGKPVAAQSTLTIPAVQTPAIGIVKSADISSFSAPGTLVSYSYLVTNTGNVDLGSVTVSDPMANLSPVSCPATTLAPAAFETCTASYTTTQADVDAGGITNTGTAFGTPVNVGSQGSGAGAGKPVAAQSTLTIPAVQSPALSVKKSSPTASYSAVGNSITYDFLVTNTGNVTLSDISVSDTETAPATQANLSAVSCPEPSLAPEANETCTATYGVAQADLNNGSVSDSATASGTPPASTTPVTSTPSNATVPVYLTTGLSYAGPNQVAVGSSFAPAAALTSAGTYCESGQQVTFSLASNPITGAATSYPLGTATTNSSGSAAVAPPVSTAGWANGAYTITASYPGTTDCGPSTATAVLAVTSPGQLAFGDGWYNVLGQTNFGFVVALVPHSKTSYAGALSEVTPGKWWFQADVTSYGKTSSTQGLLAGTGKLYLWVSTLR